MSEVIPDTEFESYLFDCHATSANISTMLMTNIYGLSLLDVLELR